MIRLFVLPYSAALKESYDISLGVFGMLQSFLLLATLAPSSSPESVPSMSMYARPLSLEEAG